LKKDLEEIISEIKNFEDLVGYYIEDDKKIIVEFKGNLCKK